MDAITAITNDHRLMESLFDRLERANGDRAELLAEVKARLMAHSIAEEIHVYPALEREGGKDAEEVHHGVEEHREAEELLVTAEEASDSEFPTAVREFVDAVKHHVEEEETEVLPRLRRSVSEETLERLGADFEQRRIAELQEFGI